jgi:hypothetical protein
MVRTIVKSFETEGRRVQTLITVTRSPLAAQEVAGANGQTAVSMPHSFVGTVNIAGVQKSSDRVISSKSKGIVITRAVLHLDS